MAIGEINFFQSLSCFPRRQTIPDIWKITGKPREQVPKYFQVVAVSRSVPVVIGKSAAYIQTYSQVSKDPD